MEQTIDTSLASVLNNASNRKCFKKFLLGIQDEEEIKDALYEVVVALKNGDKVKTTYQRLATGKIGFHGDAFKDQREKQAEEDQFITNPAEVEEGVHECECGSRRTVSFTLQTSAGDESTAVWAQCVECYREWRA